MVWLRILVGVVVGNLLYFLLAPHLPPMWRHRPFHLDGGTLLDLLFCIAVFYAAAPLTRR